MMPKKFPSRQFLWFGLALLLLLLAACGGSIDEAVEDTSGTDTGAVDDTTDSEAIEDDNIGATGSEEDSGELPPTPEPGSKVETPRTTGSELAGSDTAVVAPPSVENRIDSGEPAVARPIDLVLLMDATGSMANELQSLQAGLSVMRNALASLPNNASIRFGLVLYRDLGKSDSVQVFELTNEWSIFSENLARVTATGGGDYAEDLNAGFYQAVTGLSWQPEAEKLLILIGDAPPQTSSGETVPYETTLLLAAEQDIFIFTLGSEGLDESGTAIYQQIAQGGNGRFIQIGNDPDSGQQSTTAVYPVAELPAAVIDIVLEVLNAPSS